MKNKQLSKAMYVFAALFLVCPSMTYAKTKAPRSAPGTAIFVMSEAVKPVTVETRHMKYSDKTLKLNMEVPVIRGVDCSFQKKFNKEMKLSAQSRKNEMIKLAKMFNKDLKKDGLKPIAFEYMEDFSVVETIPPYYTLALFKYEYNGGAHGLSEVTYLTFDSNNGQTIMLKDVFKDKIDYRAVLDTIIRKQIALKSAENQSTFYSNNDICLIKENQPFFFDANGDLNVVYNPYEIAPYSAGTICITVPLKELLPYMK